MSEHLTRTEAEFRDAAGAAHRCVGECIADLMTNCVAVTATLGKKDRS